MKRSLLLTVDVEEWYHSQWFDVKKITEHPTSTCEKDIDEVLQLFKKLRIYATFFVLGEIAEKSPQIVEKILAEGHEVACHGYSHISLNCIKKQELNIQIKKAKSIIESIVKDKIIGYRAPNYSITPVALTALSSLGFIYDSSVVPCIKIPGWYGNLFVPTTPYKIEDKKNGNHVSTIWEVPVAVFPYLRLPAGGGWFLRNFGVGWLRIIGKALLKKGPVTFYIHPWEVSDTKPLLKGIPFHVFRRTGNYVKEAIKCLVNDFRASSFTIRELLEKEYL